MVLRQGRQGLYRSRSRWGSQVGVAGRRRSQTSTTAKQALRTAVSGLRNGSCRAVEEWQKRWTQGQKLWCCATYQRGCHEEEFQATWASYGPRRQAVHQCAGEPRSWPHSKLTWCCSHQGHGCALAFEESSTAAYDAHDHTYPDTYISNYI